MRPVTVAGLVAAALLLVPLFFALASQRGWLPDRFWNPDIRKLGWLERHIEARPWLIWVVGLVSGSVWAATAVYDAVTGDAEQAVVHALQAVLWGLYPYFLLRQRRSMRADEERARCARGRGQRQDDPTSR